VKAAHAGPPLQRDVSGTRTIKPAVHLDRLDLPPGTPGESRLKRHLRRTLVREARNLDWGAGRGDRIEYRFAVQKLAIVEGDGVVTVTCTALGYLPKGKRARSHLSFSGAPTERNALVRKVLDIVARGVLTRLSELERARRGIAPLS
jgi:hypothetical protein